MIRFTFDVLAIATVDILAASEESARQTIHDYQGARFDTQAIDAESYGYRDVELRTLSTRGRAALMDAKDMAGGIVATPDEYVGDPEHHVLMPDAKRQELEELLTAWDVAARGLQRREHAAHALAEAVRALLGR
jgi:hypothetical protein